MFFAYKCIYYIYIYVCKLIKCIYRLSISQRHHFTIDSNHGPSTRRPLSGCSVAWRIAFQAKSLGPKAPRWMDDGKHTGNSVFRKEIDMNWLLQGCSNQKCTFLNCQALSSHGARMTLLKFWGWRHATASQMVPKTSSVFLLTNTNESQNNTEWWQRQWVEINIYYDKTKHQHSLGPSTGIAIKQVALCGYCGLYIDVSKFPASTL